MTSLIYQLMDYNKQGADKLAGRQVEISGENNYFENFKEKLDNFL